MMVGVVPIPEGTEALLWDMDGVLIDSLRLDLEVSAPLFSRYLGREIQFSAELIRSLFAFDPEHFVRELNGQAAKEGRAALSESELAQLLAEYLVLRRVTDYPLTPRIEEALVQGSALGLPMAVVSNNTTEDIELILARTGLRRYFQIVLGNDRAPEGRSLRKKPAPDFYLLAAEMLGASPKRCLVFEDSAVGVQAGLAAGASVIALLTGGGTEEELRQTIADSPTSMLLESLFGERRC